MIRLTSLAAAMLLSSAAFAERVQEQRVQEQRVQEQREWTETFEVSANATLSINNIWGDVTVEPGEPGKIVVAISEDRSAPSLKNFNRSLEVIPLVIDADREYVSLEVGQQNGNWYRKDPCRGCRVEYTFVVQAPPGTTLDVSTVNDGVVRVSGINGRVSAGNVNGPVTVTGATDCETVESVNGAVALSFTQAPGTDCAIETINGDISLRVPEGAGLDVAMDLFNGKMVSELPADPLAIPATVEESRSEGRYQYRVKQPAGIRLAGGGPVFTISSMNGDINIKNH